MTTGARVCSFFSGMIAIIMTTLAICFYAQFSYHYTSKDTFTKFCNEFKVSKLIGESCFVPSDDKWPRFEVTEKAAIQQVCGLATGNVNYDAYFVRMAHTTSRDIIDQVHYMMLKKDKLKNQYGYKHISWVGAEKILHLDEHSGEFWWFNLYGDKISRVHDHDQLNVAGTERYAVLHGQQLESRNSTTEAYVLCEFRIRNHGTFDEIVNDRYKLTQFPLMVAGLFVIIVTCLILAVLFGVFGYTEAKNEDKREHFKKNMKKMKHYKNCVNQLEASGVDVGDMSFKQAGHRTRRRSRRAPEFVDETASMHSSRSSRSPSRSSRSSRRSRYGFPLATPSTPR